MKKKDLRKQRLFPFFVTRVPLQDPKFAELTFKIPSELKLKGNKQKYILKESVKDAMPETVMNRPKTGFGSTPFLVV